MVTAPIPEVPFSPPLVPCQKVPPAELIDGGPVAAMHRDIKARLMRAFPPVQFTHRTMPARLTPEGWARLTERLPMVALGWLKLTPPEGRAVRGRVWSGRSHWTIFLVCKNPEIEAQLLGDALGVGMLGMLAVATAALHGHSIAGIGAAEIGERGQAYTDALANAQVAQAALNLSVPFDLVDAAGLTRLDDFLRLGQRWPGVPDLVSNLRDDGVSLA
jgi:hypothetical protein